MDTRAARKRPTADKRRVSVYVQIDVAKLFGKMVIAGLIAYALASGDGERAVAFLISKLL